MKFIFVTTMCCQLLLSPVFSQRVVPEPSFPIEDDEICFQEIVLAPHYTQDAIFQKIQNWAAATQRKYHLKITHSQEVANDYFINGILKIDGDKKDPYEVDCSFTMHLTIIDGRFRYELKDILLLKAGQNLSATLLYNGYLKKDPVSRAPDEPKQSALNRHRVLLNNLYATIDKFLTSMKSNYK